MHKGGAELETCLDKFLGFPDDSTSGGKVRVPIFSLEYDSVSEDGDVFY